MVQKRIFALVVLFSFILGCAPRPITLIRYQVLSPKGVDEIIPFDLGDLDKSYQRFLDNLFDRLNIPPEISNHIGYNDLLAVECMERVGHSIEDIQISIDRALINKLLRAGIVVLERSPFLLYKLLAEQEDDPDVFINVYKSTMPPATDTLFVKGKKENIRRPTKILAYRLLDLSIIQYSDTVRQGFVEMEMRLVDAQTSALLAVAYTKATFKDVMTREDLLAAKVLKQDKLEDPLPLRQTYSLVSILKKPITKKTQVGQEGIELICSRSGVRDVNVGIYNTAGEQVSSFYVPKRTNATSYSYSYTWNLRDSYNKRVPAGTYWLYMISPSGTPISLMGTIIVP